MILKYRKYWIYHSGQCSKMLGCIIKIKSEKLIENIFFLLTQYLFHLIVITMLFYSKGINHINFSNAGGISNKGFWRYHRPLVTLLTNWIISITLLSGNRTCSFVGPEYQPCIIYFWQASSKIIYYYNDSELQCCAMCVSVYTFE